MPPEHAISRNLERIILTGFMGAGKSTVGPILADRLGWKFLDSDHELESESGATIAHLFSTLGEPAFREKEAQTVARLCTTAKTVLSLGGGVLETEAIRLLLTTLSNTYVVFLQAPLEILIDRCEHQPNAAERPVLRQREALKRRFDARLPYYRSAHLTVNTEGLDPSSVAGQILHQIVEMSCAIQFHQKAILA